MWKNPNMTTSPARPGEPSSVSRATARSQLARCDSTAAFATPVDPLVRNTAQGSSAVPTRASGVDAGPVSQSSTVTMTSTPSGPAAVCAQSALDGCATTIRGRKYSIALAASLSVNVGLTGEDAAT